MLHRMTCVPLAPDDIAGIINLRGRIVTAIDLRRRLGMPGRRAANRPMAVGIECEGESYGLIIDAVGEVLKLGDRNRRAACRSISMTGLSVLRPVSIVLETGLLVVLDVDRLLDLKPIGNGRIVRWGIADRAAQVNVRV